MKKIKYLLPIIMLLFTINVKAVDQCTNEEMKRLKELANKVDIKYDYTIDDSEGEEFIRVFYTLKIINMSPELELRYNYDTSVSVEELQDELFSSGENMTLQIYSYTDNSCTNDLLRVIKLDFPFYNSYYYSNKDKCKNYPNFYYCKEFTDKSNNKPFEEINKLLEEYINNDKSENVINKNDIKSFVEENKYFIGGTVVIILLILIIIIIIKKRKKEDL